VAALSLPRLVGARYVVPLREGGSLPAVVDTEQDGAFVVKFRGAGQGLKALIAETLVAGLADALGLPVPRPALVELDEGFGRSEPDPEIQDLLRGSVGTNFGLAYLSGALAFDPAVDGPNLSASVAADIVWFDAYVTNVDRTARNTNLLVWEDGVWMIDHGAALYMHHRWAGWEQKIQSAFQQISDHVLLAFAGDLNAADERLRGRLSEQVIREVVASVPEEWFSSEPEFSHTGAQREAYVRYLVERLNGPRAWLETAVAARRNGPAKLSVRQTHRVV
jgi:hypothetical protein